MSISDTIDYWLAFPEIPFQSWKKWRKRRVLFKQRGRVPLEKWAETYGVACSSSICKETLRGIGYAFIVDPTRLRPSDRFTSELSLPTLGKQSHAEDDFWDGIIEDNREAIIRAMDLLNAPPFPMPLVNATVEQLLLHVSDRLNSLQGLLSIPKTRSGHEKPRIEE